MSYRSQTKSRRNTGRGRRKAHREKSKAKKHRKRYSGKYLLEKNQTATSEEIVDVTLSRLHRLGGQTFAFSPFSQYFDDWLLSLRSVLSEFEANSAVNVDEEFVRGRSQVIADVKLKLSKRRREEAVLEKATRRLANQKNLLIQIDTGYTSSTHELASKKNSKIKPLTRRIRALEEELEETSRMKASIFSPFARRAKSHKTAEVIRKIDAVKSEVESIVKAFEVEQAKLHAEYETEKQSVIRQVRNLKKEVEVLETDGSVEDRRVACKALVKAVKALLQRKKLSPK